MTNDHRGPVAVTVLAMLLVASLAGTALTAADRRAQQRLAVSRGLTLRAASLRGTQPVVALRLGIAAVRIRTEPQVRAGLQATLAGGRRTATFTDDTGAVRGVAFSPDGRTLATATSEESEAAGLTAVWDLSDPAGPRRIAILIVTLPGRTAGVSAVGFTADGHGIVNAIDGGTFERWDVTDPRAARRTSVFTQPGLEAAAFSPDRRRLAAFRDEAVELWDLTDWAAPRRTATLAAAHVAGVAFSPDGRTLATNDGTTALGLWDVTDLAAPRRTSTVAVNLGALVFGPDGRSLATVDPGTGAATLWDVGDRAAPRPSAHLTGSFSAAAFDPDGRTVATAGDDGIDLWDITDPATPRRSATLADAGPRSGTDVLMYGRDGRTLLAAGSSGLIELWGVSRPADVAADPVREACRIAGGGLTPAEWRTYVPELSYRRTCPD